MLFKNAMLNELVHKTAKLIKLAAINSTITTNPKGIKFLNLFGDTFPVKDKLNNLGFRYFKGTWGIALERAKAIRPTLDELGIDTSVFDSEMATAVAPTPSPTQTDPTQAPIAKEPTTPTEKTLVQMRKAIDEEMKAAPANEKAKAMLAFIDKMIDKVANSVDEAAKSEFVRSFLAFASRFHEYSFGNQMLIWVQKPDASYVSGHKQWLEKGRQVTKWNQGISILAPRIKKYELSNEQKANLPPDAKTERQYMYFIPVTVYDVSSTDPIAGWKDKEGRGPFEPGSWRKDPNTEEEQITLLVQAASQFATSMGIVVDLEKELRQELGGYSKGGEIAVNKLYKGINQFSTLAHEIAHEILHREDENQKMMTRDSKQGKEIDAETTAYIVLQHYGYETQDTPNYIALWKGTGENVRQRRNNISKAVKIIIKGIDETMGKVIPAMEDETLAWVHKNCKFAKKDKIKTLGLVDMAGVTGNHLPSELDIRGPYQRTHGSKTFRAKKIESKLEIGKVADKLKRAMKTGYYALLWAGSDVRIIFRDRIFQVSTPLSKGKLSRIAEYAEKQKIDDDYIFGIQEDIRRSS